MKTLISSDFLHLQLSQFSLSCRYPRLKWENRRFFISHRRKCLQHSIASGFCSAGAHDASVSDGFRGWNDNGFITDSGRSGELDWIRNFFESIGINDRKHVFAFFLGIAGASAIYRVRISYFILFPACAIVFAVGFSFGFIRGRSVGELIVNGNKRREREEAFRVYPEKLSLLAEFLNDFDRKIGGLTSDIQRAILSRRISTNELENHITVLQANSLSISNARKTLGALVDYGDDSNTPMVENQKHQRENDLHEIGSEILQFVGRLFGETYVESKPSKVKNHVKRETRESGVIEKAEGNGSDGTCSSSASSITDEKRNKSTNLFQDSRIKYDMDQDDFSRLNTFPEIGKINLERSENQKRHSKEYEYLNNRLQFTRNDSIFSKKYLNKGTELFRFSSNKSDPVELNLRMKHKKIKASFVEERVLEKSRQAYKSSRNIEEDELFGSQFRDKRMNQVGEVSSSSFNYDDEVFDSYLTEANDLLKQAKGFMRNRNEEELAEINLDRSADLLSKAIAMNPTSLLAVGQLGNTYLLHGKLKLRIIRELRHFLSENDHLSGKKWSRTINEQSGKMSSDEDLTSFLINVCEECEELLMEAGRKYRLALSIDSNDARALYNWGLALSFRAQLIADIGPDAAADADKVFMAAVDKFDSLLSINNAYAPDALFRWGEALQQRSQLRPSNSKERMKLLKQAKRLYEDALDLDSENLQVREALLSCVSELKFNTISKF